MSLIEKLTTAATLAQWVDVVFFLLVGAAASSLCGAFICRVRMLTLKENDAVVWLMNVAGGILFGWIALDVVRVSNVEPMRLAALVFGACWIRLSLHTWGNGGPPEHTSRGIRGAS